MGEWESECYDLRRYKLIQHYQSLASLAILPIAPSLQSPSTNRNSTPAIQITLNQSRLNSLKNASEDVWLAGCSCLPSLRQFCLLLRDMSTSIKQMWYFVTVRPTKIATGSHEFSAMSSLHRFLGLEGCLLGRQRVLMLLLTLLLDGEANYSCFGFLALSIWRCWTKYSNRNRLYPMTFISQSPFLDHHLAWFKHWFSDCFQQHHSAVKYSLCCTLYSTYLPFRHWSLQWQVISPFGIHMLCSIMAQRCFLKISSTIALLRLLTMQERTTLWTTLLQIVPKRSLGMNMFIL